MITATGGDNRPQIERPGPTLISTVHCHVRTSRCAIGQTNAMRISNISAAIKAGAAARIITVGLRISLLANLVGGRAILLDTNRAGIEISASRINGHRFLATTVINKGVFVIHGATGINSRTVESASGGDKLILRRVPDVIGGGVVNFADNCRAVATVIAMRPGTIFCRRGDNTIAVIAADRRAGANHCRR